MEENVTSSVLSVHNMDILPAIVLKETPIEMDKFITRAEVKESTVIVEDT